MILIRFGEIFLKGKNRIDFERQLSRNIRAALKAEGSQGRLINKRNRLMVDDDSATFIKDLPGVHSISIAKELPVDLEELKKEALALAKEEEFDSFKISTQKLNKEIAMHSVEFDRLVGEEIFEKLKKKVDLKNPKLTIHIELIDNHAYLFTKKILGAGGLPLGVEGKVLALIEDEAGLSAAKKVMRRGAIVYPVFFEENEFAGKIEALSPGFRISAFRISAVGQVDTIAKETNARALVVPDRIDCVREYEVSLPILRPLISVI